MADGMNLQLTSKQVDANETVVSVEGRNKVTFDVVSDGLLQPRARANDLDKITDDLEFSLDYQISRTAMEKISAALKDVDQDQFNQIVRKLEEKDRKFQGMDLELSEWHERERRWDAIKLHNTDMDLTTYMIVQKGDSAKSIADVETKHMPRRRDSDVENYMEALAAKNRNVDLNNLKSGQILVLPYPS